MTKLSTLILTGFIASTMLASSVMAQPAPSNTPLATTPAELRVDPTDRISSPVAEKSVVVEPAKSVTAPAKKKTAKKAAKKLKSSKPKAKAKQKTDNSSTTK
jgi:hypothetical protein